MRYAILLATLLSLLLIAAPKGGLAVDNTLPSNVVPSGKAMYKQYCAVCHDVKPKVMAPMLPC